MKAKKRVAKRRDDKRKITVSVPEEIYFQIKHYAKDEIRTISQQTRLFIEVGLQIMAQQQQDCGEGQEEPPEKESCIGFHVDRSEDYDDE